MSLIKSFVLGDSVEGAYILKSAAVKETKDGNPYLDASLADTSGEINCKLWSYNGPLGSADAGKIVIVAGKVTSYRDCLQLGADSIRLAVDADHVDVSQLIPMAPIDCAAMLDRIERIVGSITDTDYLASLKCEDLPTVRALLICMKYAAETNSFDRFLSFVEECGAKDCFSDIQTFLSCVNMTYESGSPEFYRQLALYGLVTGRSSKRKTPAFPQKDTVKNWWDLFREDAAPFYSQFYSSKLYRKTKLLLLEIDRQAMCSEYSVDETGGLLAYYNPMLLIQNYVCPEEVRFPHLESGGIDFSAVSPKGVPLTMLERMLRAGYLSKDSDQTIWRRMAE